MYTHVKDINTLKDDVKSLNRLLPVIKDLADNETDYIIQDYYEKIVYSTNRSIAALNNLVSLLAIILFQHLFTIDCSIGEEQ